MYANIGIWTENEHMKHTVTHQQMIYPSHQNPVIEAVPEIMQPVLNRLNIVVETNTPPVVVEGIYRYTTDTKFRMAIVSLVSVTSLLSR